MTNPAIMAYVGSDANVVGITGVALPPYAANNQVYGVKEGPGATDGFRQFIGLASGDESLTHTRLEVGGIAYIQSPYCLTYDGQMVFVASVAFNSPILGCIKVTDLTLSSTFGIPSGSLVQSDGTRILLPHNFAPVIWGSPSSFSSYVISCAAVGAGTGEVCILTVPNILFPTLVNNFVANIDEEQGVAGPGEISSTFGTGYVLGKNQNYGVHKTTPLGLYVLRVSALPLTFTKKGTLAPAQVDPTWTHYAGAGGVSVDRTDGNPIIQVFTDNPVVNKVYFVKLSKVDASVIWACPVNFQDPQADGNMGRHKIINQRLYYLGSGNRLYTIDTATGTATSEIIGTLTANSQISEDVNNSLIGYGQWFEGATHPDYVGTYMGTLGNHMLASNTWWRYFPGGVGVIPPVPSPTPPIPPELVVTPPSPAVHNPPTLRVVPPLVAGRWLLRTGHIIGNTDVSIDDLRLVVKRGVGSNTTAPTIWVRANRDNQGFGRWVRKGLGVHGDRVLVLYFGGFGTARDWQFEIATQDDCEIELRKCEVLSTPMAF